MPRAVSPRKSRELRAEVPLVMQDLHEPVVQVVLVAVEVVAIAHLSSLGES